MGILTRTFCFVVISFFIGGTINAQLCQGSLGDPIVNITFGAGTNPGPSLQAATTTYQYVSGDCPGDGFYTVRNNSTNCFGSTWHSLTSDHTGDANGYFMLVNASFQPSAFYLDTVRGLCSGTTYEFAAWVMNVLKTSSCGTAAIQPNLTFTIEKTDGTVLQSYNTNDIPSQASPTWQQFGFFFTTPVNVSTVVLRIFNNAPGGCGNDLALDDITFRPCGPKLSSTITGHAGTTINLCQGETESFVLNCNVSAGFNNPSFQWQQSSDGVVWTDIPGATTTSLTKNIVATTPVGNYFFRLSAAEAGNMSSAKCRVVSNPITIKVNANPVTAVTSNGPLCENSALVLTASGGSQYQWRGVNNFSATSAVVTLDDARPNLSGKYYVAITTDAGCKGIDSIVAVVNPRPVAATSFSEQTICAEHTIQLESSGGDTYQWLPATGLSSSVIANPVAFPSATTAYSVIVANQFGCSDTAVINLNIIDKPTANAGADKWIIQGNTEQLSAAATGQNISYSWTPDLYIDNNQSLQPLINPPRDTTYILTVVSNDGCGTATDTMKVFVYKDVFVPTAFSPNGDGVNDSWRVPALSAYPGFELSVFNRYGQLVFQSKNNNKPWNGIFKGEPLPSGVYVYMIDLKMGGDLLKGTVTLIR